MEQASRQAIADLHQLVGVLRRQDEADDDLAPQPGLRQLPTLVAQMSRAGLATQLTVKPRTASAVNVVAWRRPDVVLIDIQMPGIDGLRRAARFSATNATRHAC